MIEQTIRTALPIFQYAFPGCRGVWAFDNATNHSAYSPQALLASRMNLGPGGKQSLMVEGFDYQRNLPHAMVFSDNHRDYSLRGKAKDMDAGTT